jgi:hypothetical protein
MNNLVKVLLAAGAIFCVQAGLSAQSGSSSEMSAEEYYLQEPVEIMIIREQSRADDRDGKFLALEYIREAVESGNTGEEIRSALEYMALEGILNQTRENGRLVNNYPDVRLRSVEYLGNLKTSEARDTLLVLMLNESQVSIQSEIIRSLTRMLNAGITDRAEESLSRVVWITQQYDARQPDNNLALMALNYFDTFAKINGGVSREAIQLVQRISNNGRYIQQIRTRARTLLTQLTRPSQSGNSRNSGSNR